MTDSYNITKSLDLLERTLEAFGANPARWPVDARAELQNFITGNVQAQAKMAEAQSLDRVLGFAPVLSAGKNAKLADRIVVAAQRQPRAVSSQTLAVRTPSVRFANRAMVAVALAASLVLGVMVGQNTSIGALADAIVNGETASSSQQVATGDDADVLLYEDVL